jgi:hypothetical protein
MGTLDNENEANIIKENIIKLFYLIALQAIKFNKQNFATNTIDHILKIQDRGKFNNTKCVEKIFEKMNETFKNEPNQKLLDIYFERIRIKNED